jgi:UDP-glucose 4-epimerase
VIAIFLNAMAAGEETTIYGDGGQTRDFVHVDDVVRGLLLAPGRGGVFNIGSGVETSVLELHERCRAVSGDDRTPLQAPPREGDVRRNVLDVSLADRELGWRPEVSLAEGLRRTWDWLGTRA